MCKSTSFISITIRVAKEAILIQKIFVMEVTHFEELNRLNGVVISGIVMSNLSFVSS